MKTAYEVLMILDPEVPDERQTEIVGRVRELVGKSSGEFLTHDTWGKRKLAYEIAKKDEGVYHFLTFDTEPETLDEIARVLKITDGVMRHLAVRRVAGGSRTAPPAVVTPARDADADADRDAE